MPVLDALVVGEGPKRYYEEAAYSVTLISNIINKNISAQLAPHRLTPGQFNVLMVIKHLGGKEGVKQVEISKNLVLTPSNITKLIDKLEKEKLVVRLAPSKDRRVNLVKITEKGSLLVDKASVSSVAEFRKMAGQVSQDKIKAMSSVLMEWLVFLQEYESSPS